MYIAYQNLTYEFIAYQIALRRRCDRRAADFGWI